MTDHRRELLLEPYLDAKKEWPGSGKHILAHYDEESVVVYQAYNSKIGSYAAKNKRFAGCPEFSNTRMTWIKTNFLWMQYRSGWGSKPNQEVTLAIWLKREAFEQILELAQEADKITASSTKKKSKRQKRQARGRRQQEEGEGEDGDHEEEEEGETTGASSTSSSSSSSTPASTSPSNKRLVPGDRPQGFVRLQWDPDHSPSGGKMMRRAIQLGLRGLLGFVEGDWILDIQDISELVQEQSNKAPTDLKVPRERVYIPLNKENARRIRVDLDREGDWKSEAEEEQKADLPQN